MTPPALFLALFSLILSTANGNARCEPLRVVDFQETRIVTVEPDRAPPARLQAEIAVIGGGVGGLAAALAACESGHSVVLTEETDWLGGQFTAQGLSAPDENQFIEQSGGTRSYQDFRRRIRDWYRRYRRLAIGAKGAENLNPGNCWVSRLCCEPKVALAVIEELLAPHLDSGRLRVLKRHKALRCVREGERIVSLDLVRLDSGTLCRLEAACFLDATELGDLLPICGVEHVIGAEARAETNEPHARPDGPEPDCVQAFTYCFIVAHRPGEEHVIPRPPDYERNRERQPYSQRVVYYDSQCEEVQSELLMFRKAPTQQGSFWTFRRIIDRQVFAPGVYACDLAIINWPGNDYRGKLLTASPEEVVAELRAAKSLSLGFLHWLQTELPNDDGGRGYPGLELRRDLLGSEDGLAKFPYIREARRIKTREPLREQDLLASLNMDRFGGKFWHNSIGIGFYPIDIHPGLCDEIIVPRDTWPFQIPLGVLVPIDVVNLIPAGKCAGTTHITNGCTRLHPVEWAIGEAAGALASLCVRRNLSPQDVHADIALVRELQRQLVARGAPIYWYTSVRPTDPDFTRVQFAPFFSDSIRRLRAGKPTQAPGK